MNTLNTARPPQIQKMEKSDPALQEEERMNTIDDKAKKSSGPSQTAEPISRKKPMMYKPAQQTILQSYRSSKRSFDYGYKGVLQQ